jgi:hypothetical protein
METPHHPSELHYSATIMPTDPLTASAPFKTLLMVNIDYSILNCAIFVLLLFARRSNDGSVNALIIIFCRSSTTTRHWTVADFAAPADTQLLLNERNRAKVKKMDEE